jgi:hypothetical protein
MHEPTWVLAAHLTRGFQRVALRGNGVVHLAWTREEPQDDPGSSMPVARTELLLTRDGRATRVDLDKVVGTIEPASATLCARLGFRTAEGTALDLPRVDGLVSALSVGSASGADAILVVLGGCAGGCALEVLRSRTSDGMCEAQAKQGPLTACHGEEYERVAEVHLVPPASFDESVRVTTTGEAGTTTAPLDCAAPTLDGSLLPPVGARNVVGHDRTQ